MVVTFDIWSLGCVLFDLDVSLSLLFLDERGGGHVILTWSSTSHYFYIDFNLNLNLTLTL